MKVKNCQVCNSTELEEIISLGYLPHPNKMQEIGSQLEETTYIPHELLRCKNCTLVQLGFIADQATVFPPDYAYTSRTTKILRDNFAQLAEEISKVVELKKDDLVVDIGSNDGTSLSNYKNKCRVLGVEPTNNAKFANKNNIPTTQKFFNLETAKEVKEKYGQAIAILISNCFAHIADIHSVMKGINELLKDGGIFVSENHYLEALTLDNAWETIYSEHLKYFNLTSLKYLFKMYGFEIFDFKRIKSHGNSIRVYAAKIGERKISDKVYSQLSYERGYFADDTFKNFKKNVIKSKYDIYKLLSGCGDVGAVSAPSRGTTYINYTHLDENIIKFILEVPGSQKINKYLPGTKIKIIEETKEILNSVDTLLILSWHLSEEIMANLRNKGFTGNFLIALPFPKIVV